MIGVCKVKHCILYECSLLYIYKPNNNHGLIGVYKVKTPFFIEIFITLPIQTQEQPWLDWCLQGQTLSFTSDWQPHNAPLLHRVRSMIIINRTEQEGKVC